jgi:hypothetical protein
LYRARWQIELSFKRIKSLLPASELRQTTPESAMMWLPGKMLYALLLEACVGEAGAFSPVSPPWPGSSGTAQCLRCCGAHGH